MKKVQLYGGAMITTAGKAAVALLLLSATAQAADEPTAFNQCKACHKVAAGENGVGPSLFGVFGRKAGSAAGYSFSDAMKKYGAIWNDSTLEQFLTDPKKTVPGTKQNFPGVKRPEDVKAIIAYMKTLK